jgi:hypothetical protein
MCACEGEEGANRASALPRGGFGDKIEKANKTNINSNNYK